MLTTVLILFPFLCSLILFGARRKDMPVMALAFALLEWGLSLMAGMDIFSGDLDLDIPWIPSLGISFSVAMDGISLPMVWLTTTLVPLIVWSTRGNERPPSFYALAFLMESALIGVFTAMDGLLFYLFWELALIPIYFICLLWGGEGKAFITLKFFIYTLAGSLLMLVALVALYLQVPGTPDFSMAALYAAGQTLSPEAQGYVFWAFFIAFAIKMPVFPFHTWQPDTYTMAPVQGTMLLSGIMLKMGVYGMVRWLVPIVPMGMETWGSTAMALCVVGMVYASAIALGQRDLKRLIAYSSMAHVGLMAAGILTLEQSALQAAVFQMVSHGFLVFALFYIVDIIERRAGGRDIEGLGGIRHVAPALSLVFMVVLLGSVALPLTSGFVGEFLLISALVKYNIWMGAGAGLTIILGAVYMLKAYRQTMLGPKGSIAEQFTDLTLSEKFVLYPVVGLVIGLGIYPLPLLSISSTALENMLNLFITVSLH